MKAIRVLVVEDSVTVRRHLCDVLSAADGIELAGEAGDGERGIVLCRETSPDVISLDIVLPRMSGLALTEEVMSYKPTPILIVSSSMNRGEVFTTYEALAAGAVDVLDKPHGDEIEGTWERQYLDRIRLVSRIRAIPHPRGRLRDLGIGVHRDPPGTPVLSGRVGVVAIGASTGGPAALLEILHELQPPYPLPILIVLHISEPFSRAIAEWLSERTGHRVEVARGGESLESLSGRVILAPAESHLVVRNRILELSNAPERHSCRPSVDLLFESLARECGDETVGCLLSGMGKDGAGGLLQIRRAGGRTLVQDEESSIVWGMPGEAVALGAAERILPLSRIAPAFAAFVSFPVLTREGEVP
jgi:two-component system chemotaxis response regulator CheB